MLVPHRLDGGLMCHFSIHMRTPGSTETATRNPIMLGDRGESISLCLSRFSVVTAIPAEVEIIDTTSRRPASGLPRWAQLSHRYRAFLPGDTAPRRAPALP